MQAILAGVLALAPAVLAADSPQALLEGRQRTERKDLKASQALRRIQLRKTQKEDEAAFKAREKETRRRFDVGLKAEDRALEAGIAPMVKEEQKSRRAQWKADRRGSIDDFDRNAAIRKREFYDGQTAERDFLNKSQKEERRLLDVQQDEQRRALGR